MDVAEIKEYLGMIIDTEEVQKVQRQLLGRAEMELNKCNASIQGVNTTINNIKKPEKGLVDNSLNIVIAIVCAFAIGALSLVLFDILAYNAPNGTLYTVIFGILLFSFDDDFPIIHNCPLMPIIIGIISFILIIKKLSAREKRKNNEHFKGEEAEYNEKIRKYKLTLSSYDVEKQYLTNQISLLRRLVSNTDNTLKQLYNCDIIHPKYKKLDYVVLIYECLDTGRCNTLVGPDGAYNKVELDYRLDTISQQLNTIIDRLGDIRGIMRGMRRDISSLSGWMSRMDSSINDLNKGISEGRQDINNTLKQMTSNTELFTYQQERIARELEYANRINYLQGKNKVSAMGMDLSRPPHLMGN